MLCSAVYSSLLDLLLLLLSRPLPGVRPRVLDLGPEIPDLGLRSGILNSGREEGREREGEG